MTTGLSQGEFNIDRMCWLAGVSRASYYRHWLDSAPRRAETGLRDLIQKMALGNAHYGYRRIGALLRREGWQVNRMSGTGLSPRSVQSRRMMVFAGKVFLCFVRSL